MPVPKRHQRFRCWFRGRLGTFQYQFSTKSITASPTMLIAIILAYSFYAKRSSLKRKILCLSPAFLISKSTFPHTFFNVLPHLLFYAGTCQSFFTGLLFPVSMAENWFYWSTLEFWKYTMHRKVPRHIFGFYLLLISDVCLFSL